MNDDNRAERHERRHDVDDIVEAQHQHRHDAEDRADVVTRSEVTNLISSVRTLEKAITGLSEKMDRQWRAQSFKRKKLAVILMVYTIVVAYGVGSAIDHHVKNCMVLGAPDNAHTQTLCNVTIPFHNHPLGGINDESLGAMIERAIELRERELEP